MTERRDLNDVEALVKIVGMEYPIRTRIKEFDGSGFWIYDDSLRITLVQQTPLKGIPKHIEPSPVIFLPLPSVQWLLANPEDVGFELPKKYVVPDEYVVKNP